MRKNTIRQIWARGGVVITGWCSIPSSFSAEVMAHQGFDSLCIDMQHGAIDYQVAVTMLQAISTTSVIPIVRVPWNDPARLMKMLDAGAYGVICPMINNRAQAEALASACKYPPMLAFFFYPGSYGFLFFAMLALGILGAAVEAAVYKLGGGNLILCSLMAFVVAYRYVHFGYVPARSFL